MKYLMFPFLLLIDNIILLGQSSINHLNKPSLNFSVSNKWPIIDGEVISNNGQYVFYVIKNHTVGRKTGFIQSTIKQWKFELTDVSNVQFSYNNQYALFLQQDTLKLFNLNNRIIENIPNVKIFQLLNSPRGEWLCYRSSEPADQLVIKDLSDNVEKFRISVHEYWLGKDGASIALQTRAHSDTSNMYLLKWMNLLNGSMKEIWRGPKVQNLCFDNTSTQLAFTVDSAAIWYCKSTFTSATLLVDKHSFEEPSNIRITGISYDGFSRDGDRLYFTFKEFRNKNETIHSNAASVDVWSYKDYKLQSRQLLELNPREYCAVVSVLNRQVVRLEYDDETLFLPDRFIKSDDYAIVQNTALTSEQNWVHQDTPIGYVISTRDGKKKFNIKKTFRIPTISPAGKYVVYFDCVKKNFFSYDLALGILRNITENISTNWYRYGADEVNPIGELAGWLSGDSGVILYDRNDIWQVDLTGKTQPLNLTNGFGLRNHICFSFLSDGFSKIYHKNSKEILIACNLNNMQNGFYSLLISKPMNPNLLSMGNYIFYLPYSSPNALGSRPIKADSANVWIVKRMSTQESPNYYSTTDFKDFHRLSNISPEKHFNWITSELHSWKRSGNLNLQGILYKPENFDLNKKYPVIFYYYEKLSDRLNQYLEPKLSDGQLNVAWFVSNGYLVFEPDIHYKIGYPGASALSCVVSAAQYLSKFPFVDSKRMGIQGISFGGFETNYIVTHTNIFAAACSASGNSDMVSTYGGLYKDGRSRQAHVELEQYRIGFSLGERPDLYIKNSPVLSVKNVVTPLLLMHTKADNAVPFTQAIELFTGLRRLDKKVWMLQYDEGNHGVRGKSAEDFSIRMAQFFNHYLKNAPAPEWMVVGIPARLKQIKTGYDLDPTGNCGKDCKVCRMWNEKWRKNPSAVNEEIKKEGAF